MKRGIALAVAAVTACVGVGGTAFAAEPTSTWLSWIGTSQGRVEAIGNVCHATNEDCGSPSGDMRFTLFKRIDGSWTKLASRVSTRQEGWTVSLRAPRRGRCKMVARYLGDDVYAPSSAALRAQCNDDDWIR